MYIACTQASTASSIASGTLSLLYVFQLLHEMADMTVQQEALNTKNQLIIDSYEGHLGSLGNNLKETKGLSEEQAHVIKNLESSKAELVSIMIEIR